MNPWKILGVNRQTSEQDIHAAYIELAKKHHPDKNGGSVKKFLELNAAMQILGDRAKRSEFIKQMVARNPECKPCKGEGVFFKRKGLTHATSSSCLTCGGAGVIL